MKLLCKAYACEFVEGAKRLMPGYSVELGIDRNLKPGTKIQVELADGTRLQTPIVKTTIAFLSESVMAQFLEPFETGWYYTIQVPDDFSPEGIGLGARVFVDDSITNAAQKDNG